MKLLRYRFFGPAVSGFRVVGLWFGFRVRFRFRLQGLVKLS